MAFALCGPQTLWNTQLIIYAWTAFEKYVEIQDNGCFQDDPLGTSSEVATELVGKGDVFAIVSVTSTFAASTGQRS